MDAARLKDALSAIERKSCTNKGLYIHWRNFDAVIYALKLAIDEKNTAR